MHRHLALIVPLFFARALGAQEVFQIDPLSGSEARPCSTVSASLASEPAKSVVLCAARGERGRKCESVTASSIKQFCDSAAAKLPQSVVARLSGLGNDIRTGFTRVAARQAAEDRCPAGLPEGRLLLPGGELRLADPALTNLALLADGRGPAHSLGGSGAVLDADRLRGGSWVLAGMHGSNRISCRFTVVGGEDARALTAEFSQIGEAGRASLFEQALFFRENRLLFEYWRAVAALGNR